MTAKKPEGQSESVGWGPISRYVADNLARLRNRRGLSTTQLSAVLAERGQSIPPTGITRIEKGQRRVDADDLVALGLALNVNTSTLLLPPTAGDEVVDLTSNYQVTARTAWQWAKGERTAMDWEPGGVVTATDPSADPAGSYEEYEREQEFARRQAEYKALADPEELRRAGEQPAVRLARDLEDAVSALVTPEPGVTPADLNARHRKVKRTLGQFMLQLEAVEEDLSLKAVSPLSHLRGLLDDLETPFKDTIFTDPPAADEPEE